MVKLGHILDYSWTHTGLISLQVQRNPAAVRKKMRK